MIARIATQLYATIFLCFLLISSEASASNSGEEIASDSELLPRGVYHFSDTDRDIETSFKIPDFEALDPIRVASDLMSSAMKVDTKRKTLAGIQMPFSLTGRPMNLQINGESHDTVSLVDDPKKRNQKAEPVRRSDMSAESRKAFLRARQVCLEQSADSCDQALDTFHRIRFGKSLLVSEHDEDEDGDDENGPIRSIIEKRLKEADKPTSSTSPRDDFNPTSDHDDVSESYEDVEEPPPRDAENTDDTSNHFSHITLPKYHDKASTFLRDINN
uniref:Secreted protein n=1 Tax=Caenorhabditis japonica TaxID=281687 RepID=A0A8R1HWY5_CAEJA